MADQKTIRKLVEKVLKGGYLMTLATNDGVGIWASDVIYVYDDKLNIYWMSDPEARHSLAVGENPNVAATITVSGQGQDNLGVQFSGVAQKITGKHYELIIKHFKKRRKIVPPKNIDVLRGDYWYMLKPDYFDLIDEERFGFEKEKLNLK